MQDLRRFSLKVIHQPARSHPQHHRERRAHRAESRINIGVESKETQVIVEIGDDGPGYPSNGPM
jgi:hypothetical protein